MIRNCKVLPLSRVGVADGSLAHPCAGVAGGLTAVIDLGVDDDTPKKKQQPATPW